MQKNIIFYTFFGPPPGRPGTRRMRRPWKTGVAPGELLFTRKTPVVVANRPDINDCPAQMLKQAEESCKKKEHSFFPSQECLIDVCFGGPGFAQQDAV